MQTAQMTTTTSAECTCLVKCQYRGQSSVNETQFYAAQQHYDQEINNSSNQR